MNRDPLAHRLRDLAAARFDRMALDTPTTPAAPSMSTRVRELITDDNADHDRSPA